MAKGLRSSRNKANNSKLRAKVFGPVENARKERLSAKLLELASKARISKEEDTDMAEEEETTGEDKPSETETSARTMKQAEEMVIDETTEAAVNKSSNKSSRIEKRGRHKAKATMVFPVYKKGRRVGPRTKPRK